jgi:23S rRNA G2445 N2-methylase RlmL|tara:strand:- start:47 stop:985 length:939 start_codon:yes stop_codon:yes gene_type:complete
MKFIVKTIEGLEKVTVDEIKEKLKVSSKKLSKGFVYFECNELKELKSVSLICEFISKFKFKNKNDLMNKTKKIKFNIKNDFVVRCDREGDHKFSSLELEKEIGEVIYEQGNKVNLKSKNIIYVYIIEDYCFIGRLINKDLCKREYKLRISQNTINGCLAYSLLKLADYKKNEILVDPLCKDGVILIEAGLIGGKKLFGFEDNLYHIENSNVNSKLAKVKINLIEEDLDFLGKKFKKKSVDKIITSIFVYTKNKKKSIEKIKELIHYSKPILKKSLVLLSNINLDKYKEKLILKNKVKIKIGENKFIIHIFGI